MKEEYLHTIKSSGLKAPENYFDGLEDVILTEAKLKSITETSGLKTPKDYIENFEVTAVKETKVIPFNKRKAFIYISSIAAAILILVSLNIFKSSLSIDNLDTATIDNYILDEVETSDIASLFSESELTENQFIEYNFNEDTIDSFIENEDINELMIE